MKLQPKTLYIVGTPIGNLGDLSPRAMETLRGVDFIAAEDTRVTRKLLTHFDIHVPLVSHHEHNRQESGEMIVERLIGGACAALVSDAGMPAISDPGQLLVSLCAQKGLPVAVVPGPSAVVSGLALSGLPAGRFCFEGFLSVNRHNRTQHLAELRQETRTMVFYEAPHKLLATLRDLLSALGDRNVSLTREMTKLYEEVIRTTLSEAVARYQETPPKGEFVLVVEGAPPPPPQDRQQEALELARLQVAEGMSLRDAARLAAQHCQVSRSGIYKGLLEERES